MIISNFTNGLYNISRSDWPLTQHTQPVQGTCLHIWKQIACVTSAINSILCGDTGTQ